MDLSNLASSEAQTEFDSRVFVYEVLMPSQGGGLDTTVQRQSRVMIRVPQNRMNQFMRRINRLGGKILSIELLTPDWESRKTELPLPWWVKILTSQPPCLYYFGPFDSAQEAISAQAGYIEDLEGEQAQGITVHIIQEQPAILTQEY